MTPQRVPVCGDLHIVTWGGKLDSIIFTLSPRKVLWIFSQANEDIGSVENWGPTQRTPQVIPEEWT